MNCFHFSVSLGYTTTVINWIYYNLLLWIAFIFQYLWDTQQPKTGFLKEQRSCELLSFFSIFGIHNNASLSSTANVTVVNCFHFSVSLGYTTTRRNRCRTRNELWIAFIFQYLWDTQQLVIKRFTFFFSCELLSFFSIFGIHNNTVAQKCIRVAVVNCFHFSVSLGYTTTLLLPWLT